MQNAPPTEADGARGCERHGLLRDGGSVFDAPREQRDRGHAADVERAAHDDSGGTGGDCSLGQIVCVGKTAKTCDGISVGLGFDTKTVHLGAVTTPATPGADPCGDGG